MDQPYSVRVIVEVLADAAEHLLHDHDCDREGWERVDGALAAAREWLSTLPGGPAQDIWRGHPIEQDSDGMWRYMDGTRVDADPSRPCGSCHRPQTPDGHDPCLGTLQGVENACCGHGHHDLAYVQCGEWIMRGRAGLRFFRKQRAGPT